MKARSTKQKQGGTLTLIKIAYRNIWRNMRRTVFCFAAVGIAVFFIAVYSSFIAGMNKNIGELVRVFDLGNVRAVSQDYETNSEYMPVQYPVADGRSWREIADEIMKLEEVRAVFPRIATMATLQESTIKHAVLWGLNISDEMAANIFNFTERSDGLVEGRYPAPNSNECAVGRVFAEKAGLKIGDKIPLKTVSAQFSDKLWSPVITGIFNYDYIRFDERFIIVDYERLQRLLVMGEGTQQIVVFARDDKNSATLAVKVQNIVGEGNSITEWRDNYWVAAMDSAKYLYTLIFLVFLIVASFLIINTVVMIIHERIKEIGMMGCLGMTRKEIVTVFFFESLFMAAFGAFLGVILAAAVTGVGSVYPFRIGDIYGSTISEMPIINAIFLDFGFWNLAQAWLMGVVVAALFTLIPSLKSAFVEPVEALRR
jgi:putative ABC transport system permease protein